MKPTLTLILLVAALYSQAQINCTTSGGKQVILNTDGTWKYADGSSTEGSKECQKTYTGTITFKNLSSSDVYVYLTNRTYFAIKQVQMFKVKAGASKKIADLDTGAGSYSPDRSETYYWKALLETANPDVNFSSILGIATGQVVISTCAEKEVEIED